FVDRDMMMRFRGGGVGHKSTQEATNTFLLDRHRNENTTTTGIARPMEDNNELDEEAVDELGSWPHAQEDTLTDEEEDYVYQNPMHQQLQESDSDESKDNSDGFEDSLNDGLDDGLGPEDGEDNAEDEDDWGYAEL
ncbi:hypothetical protein C0992_013221, partial [Termitomyces sp. T32_za158]